jgi:hypothetical protein
VGFAFGGAVVGVVGVNLLVFINTPSILRSQATVKTMMLVMLLLGAASAHPSHHRSARSIEFKATIDIDGSEVRCLLSLELFSLAA